MQRGNLDHLLAFLAVGRDRSFTKAAAKLGISQSALSHAIRGLEERLGVRLLTRTTRSVSPTAAGERLLRTVGPRFDEIEVELEALSALREKPAGTIRITATDYAADTILWPKLTKFLRQYPDIKVETIIDYGLTDIVAERFDAGVRSGEQVAKDMIAVRIGPDLRIAIVGAPSYFAARPEPKRPQELIAHNCINLRLPTHGGLYAWEFEKDGGKLKVHVEGQLVFNGTFQMLNAALAGFGLAYVPEDVAQPHLAKGRLRRVLADWCPPYSGHHLYYPSRRQPTPAFSLLVDALRYRGSRSLETGDPGTNAATSECSMTALSRPLPGPHWRE
jgi:DNA-binding transcriptional LysR family regulator